MNILEIQNLNVDYGLVKALTDISLTVGEGEFVSVLGANGAGKSTLLNAIMGVRHPQSGTIRFQDQEISSLPTHLVSSLGIGYVPEGRRVFSDLTVLENLNIGAYSLKQEKAVQKEMLEQIYTLFPILKTRSNQVSGTLSGGEQQMLALSRALMLRPKLLLLDEPSMGLAPLVIKDIYLALRQINKQGTSILLVEQSAFIALKSSQRAYILESGAIVKQDTVDRLAKDPQIKKSYLGL